MKHRLHPTSVGDYVIVVDDDGALTGIYRTGQQHLPQADAWGERDDEVAGDVVEQLDEYLAGKRTAFDLALAPKGTDFQRAVWDRIAAIPYGQTRTYGEIAGELGSPSASRAVGAATGRNPISIVVPCHRVMGSSGALTGYAGGVETKAKLLDLEQRGAATGGNGERPEARGRSAK